MQLDAATTDEEMKMGWTPLGNEAGGGQWLLPKWFEG